MYGSNGAINEFISNVELVDHHVHGPLNSHPSYEEIISMFTESDRAPAAGSNGFDSQVGMAVRAHCAPLIDLERHVSTEAYFAHRRTFTPEELMRRLMGLNNVKVYLNDTGINNELTSSSQEFGGVLNARVEEIVRIESEFQKLADQVSNATELIDGFAAHLGARAVGAVGLKSIIAYRYGFDFDPEKPSREDAIARANVWLEERRATGAALKDLTLLRFALWTGLETRLPVQFHSGYGDPDVDLHRCNPLLLTDLIRKAEPIGTKLVLLHNYPYHREAGYLAHSFPSVYFDIGLAAHYAGAQSDSIIRETFELSPFSKILFSSDAWGPPELHFLGTMFWKRGVARAVGTWVNEDEWGLADAKNIIKMIASENSNRVYGLGI